MKTNVQCRKKQTSRHFIIDLEVQKIIPSSDNQMDVILNLQVIYAEIHARHQKAHLIKCWASLIAYHANQKYARI
jgi:hypothetical protein